MNASSPEKASFITSPDQPSPDQPPYLRQEEEPGQPGDRAGLKTPISQLPSRNFPTTHPCTVSQLSSYWEHTELVHWGPTACLSFREYSPRVTSPHPLSHPPSPCHLSLILSLHVTSPSSSLPVLPLPHPLPHPLSPCYLSLILPPHVASPLSSFPVSPLPHPLPHPLSLCHLSLILSLILPPCVGSPLSSLPMSALPHPPHVASPSSSPLSFEDPHETLPGAFCLALCLLTLAHSAHPISCPVCLTIPHLCPQGPVFLMFSLLFNLAVESFVVPI